ncbi:MAG: signal peptidase II [Chloroflexi bacterium]|nr:signal peptidase II [Chloroflexota bacterium]
MGESQSASERPDISPGEGTGAAASERDAGASVEAGAQERRRRWYADPLLLAVLVTAFIADQVSKALVVRNLGLYESWPTDGFFRITYARNTGTAFGLFQDQAMILTIISFVAVAAIIWFYRNTISSPILRAALGLQLGGAFGNLLDRLRLGYVVDFIDVGPWPIFNFADSSIVIGIAILAWHFGFQRGAESGTQSPPTMQTADPPAGADAEDSTNMGRASRGPYADRAVVGEGLASPAEPDLGPGDSDKTGDRPG